MQLRQLPFTELKIDRFFVDDVRPVRRTAGLIVKSIIDLAHGLGLTVTAEGIETEAQLLLLRELGCDVGPGLFRRPAPLTRRIAWLDGVRGALGTDPRQNRSAYRGRGGSSG